MASYIDDNVNRQPGTLEDDGALLDRDGEMIINSNCADFETPFHPDNPDLYWELEMERAQYAG